MRHSLSGFVVRDNGIFPCGIPCGGIKHNERAGLRTPGNLNFTSPKLGSNTIGSRFSPITSTKNSNGNNGARTLQFALKLVY
ncbi:MAG TPA: hypothetical protein VGU25_00130 [Acidobacteriaceae bacterium]|nr:hypothetical protein [Acidobacteriaceae bacterium]